MELAPLAIRNQQVSARPPQQLATSTGNPKLDYSRLRKLDTF